MKSNSTQRLATSHYGAMPDEDLMRPPRRARNAPHASVEFKLQDLFMLSIGPVFRTMHRWWLRRAERHYLICADVEQQRAREAQMNVAYYHKRAALARSARI